MNEPQFDSPLDDALDDFQLAIEATGDHKMARRYLVTGMRKLVEYTRALEARVAVLEKDQQPTS